MIAAAPSAATGVLAKQSLSIEFIPAGWVRRDFVARATDGLPRFARPFARAGPRRLSRGTPPVLRCRGDILVPPDLCHAAVKDMLNEARLEYVECDGLGAATQLDRFGSRTLKATVVEPFVALAREMARMSSASPRRTGNAAMPSQYRSDAATKMATPTPSCFGGGARHKPDLLHLGRQERPYILRTGATS